jgi:hypothetical protein
MRKVLHGIHTLSVLLDSGLRMLVSVPFSQPAVASLPFVKQDTWKFLQLINHPYVWKLNKISWRIITRKILPFLQVREGQVPARHVEIVGLNEPCGRRHCLVL